MPISLQINALYAVETEPWPIIAAEQPAADEEDATTPSNFVDGGYEGEVFAFEDRNCIADDWRLVYVVLSDDCVYIFNDTGEKIHEPSDGIVEGRQPLEGDDETPGFLDDWRDGYYRTAAADAAEALGEAAAAGAAAYFQTEAATANGAANVEAVGLADDDDAASTPFEDFFVEGKRVRVAAGDAPNFRWNGALLGPPRPPDAEPGLLMAYDDGDLYEMSFAQAKLCHQQLLLCPLDAAHAGLVDNTTESDRPKALVISTYDQRKQSTPIGVVLGTDERPLFGSELLYRAHHLRPGGFPEPVPAPVPAPVPVTGT
jgi:hypothetical protein